MFLRGYLDQSQQAAEQGYRASFESDPDWAAKFQLLEAQAMEWRGLHADARRLLAAPVTGSVAPQAQIQRMSVEAAALIRLHDFADAEHLLSSADNLCNRNAQSACGDVLRAHGLLALEQGRFADANSFFLASLQAARASADRSLEAASLVNIGAARLQQERYDEALDWLKSAQRAAASLGDENIQQAALGNLGWAYFGLGDTDRALEMFVDAEKQATKVGNLRDRLKWLSTAGNAYLALGDLPRANQSYGQALDLAREIGSKQDIVNSIEDLAHISIDSARLADAQNYLDQLAPLVRASGNRLDQLDVTLAQAKLAAAKHEDEQAKDLFRLVENDRDSQTSMRLGAEHELALLFEAENDLKGAEAMYRTALATFESARDELKEEDSKLPFLANATPVYDDYIHLLVSQARTDEALAAADQSRAQTLAQGLGAPSPKHFRPEAPQPADAARKAKATLLFYWLGEKQSYLWAITSQKTDMFSLPPAREIAAAIDLYNKTLLGPVDPLQSANEDGRALYNILVAPAAPLIPQDGIVALLTDGALSKLNFETLLAPGAGRSKAPDASASFHYWIDDVTLTSAPSISMLTAAKPARGNAGKLLLIGDAISASPDYPELPMAQQEMREIESHFPPADATVLAREQATSSAYLAGNPGRFSYIHFVTHGVASRADPLDSAIILSRAGGGEDSFKLHAREIIQHPLEARLVTISACYGSGERSYAGEGMIGLSWAFLRAGAHNVIGALWEASDEATPLLMDKLYAGLEKHEEPADALRGAKLSLLHSNARFSRPFYWAPFQIYTVGSVQPAR